MRFYESLQPHLHGSLRKERPIMCTFITCDIDWVIKNDRRIQYFSNLNQ